MLQDRLASRRLSFASEGALGRMLGIGHGSVTPLAVLNDESRTVAMVFDESLRHQVICAHPLVNTATVFIAADDVATLVREHGNPCAFLDVQAEGSKR
jgi:Ala-tRNA(Pro) deacylase